MAQPNSFVQASFHGGEWSKNYQGQTTSKHYKEAMNVCFNGLPIEEGAWVRRPGTRLSAPTYKGKPGRILPLATEQTASYLVEFTDGNIRFHNGGIPVFTEEVTMVSTITTATPAVMHTAVSVVDWQDGDEIVLVFDNTTVNPASSLILRQRILRITPVAGNYPTWSSTDTYNVNAIVVFDGNYYKSLVGNNLNNQPDTNPDKWELLTSQPHNQFALYDSITNDPIVGADVNFAPGNIIALRLLRISSPYTNGSWDNCRIVQYENTSFVLNPEVQPHQLTINPNPGDALFAKAELNPTFFVDGPYLDPIPNSILTVSGTEGIVTVVASFRVWSPTKVYAQGDYVSKSGQSYRSLVDANIGFDPVTSPTKWKKVPLGTAVTGENVDIPGFKQGDVGRHIRMFSAPPEWTPTRPFAFGDSCFYNNQAFQNISGGTLTGVQPDTNPDKWVINPTGFCWVWGKIVSVIGPVSAEVQIIPMPNTKENDLGQKLLYPTVPIGLWRLGVYSNSAGWPSCGCLHEGRLWLGGVVKNRFDASAIDISGSLTIFSPTLPDGTVTDASAISYNLLATDKNQIYWFSPEQSGIVCGTLAGEWLIQSSTQGDPLTPTSIQAKRVTKYGCANIEPRRIGMSLVFVHKFLRKCFEFITDVWTNKYIAPNLSERAKHISAPGIKELAYQEELAPVLWARLGDGNFAGTTYRRQNSATTDTPSINGWHRHKLGTNRYVEYITGSPSADGKRDTISFLTNDPDFATSAKINQQIRWVEVMTDIFEEDTDRLDAWFLDGGMVPSSMYEDTVGSTVGVRFTGLWYLRGNTVAVWAGGLDVGNYTVEDNGTVFVPYGTGTPPAFIDYTQPGAGHYMFTPQYVESIKALNFVPRNGGIFTSQSGASITFGEGLDIPTTTTIQSFVPTNAFPGETLPAGTSGKGAFMNWDAGLLTIMSANTSRGLRTFNTATGNQIADRTWEDIGYSPPVLDVGCPFKGFDDTTQLMFVVTVSNYGPVLLLDQETLATTNVYNRISIVGGTGTGSGAITATGAVQPSGLVAAGGFGHNMAIDVGVFGHKVNLIDPDGAFLNGGALTRGVGANAMIMEGTTDEGNHSFCDIMFNEGSGGIHITAFNGGITSTIFGYYGIFHTIINPVQGSYLGHQMDLSSKKNKGKKKFNIDQFPLFGPSQAGENYRSVNKIGTIHASAVHPAWTKFQTVGGIKQDGTDGGTIVIVTNEIDTLAPNWSNSTAYTVGNKVLASDDQIYECLVDNTGFNPAYNQNPLKWRYSSLQKRYIIKLAADEPTILWKVPVNGVWTESNITALGKCSAGIYIHIGTRRDNPDSANPTFPVYIIDTTSGAYKIVRLKGINGPGYQCCNGNEYKVLVKLDAYTSTVNGAPVPLNNTVSFNNITGRSTWCLLTIGSDLQNSPIPSTSDAFPKPRPVIKRTGSATGQFPCVVGFPYTSQGQILRLVDQNEQKSPSGPGIAKTRRSHYIGALLTKTQGIEFGTDFDQMELAVIKDDFGKQITPDDLFSGVVRHPLKDGYTFDSMLAWQIRRPYPTTVANIGGFSKVSDV